MSTYSTESESDRHSPGVLHTHAIVSQVEPISLGCPSIQTELGPFEGIDPELILPSLKALDPSECKDGKALYKTYKTWATLKRDQKDKVVSFFSLQCSPIRDKVLREARERVFHSSEQEKTRQV